MTEQHEVGALNFGVVLILTSQDVRSAESRCCVSHVMTVLKGPC